MRHEALSFAIIWSVLAVGMGCGGSAVKATDSDRRAVEQARVEALCRKAQPEVAELTGFAEGEPVEVVMTTEDELRQFLFDTVDLEFPAGELDRRGRCFSEIGLVPPGYELKRGLIELVEEQAGGLYDPYSKAFRWIDWLPEGVGSESAQRLIVAHELAHALQDRELDLVARFLASQGDLDSGFAFFAVMEGTAMVAGMAYAQDSTPSRLGDIGSSLRQGYLSGNAQMPAFARSPVYLQEMLISPYVDGSSFVHAFLEDDPEATMASLFDRLPATAEQTLHYGKYAEPDVPIPIDLNIAESTLPPEWSGVYSNSLGEFEIRTMCRSHAATREDAEEIAAGWDGFRVAAYDNEEGQMIVIGASAWDTEADAEEFAAAFGTILAGLHETGTFELIREDSQVVFVTGLPDGPQREALLAELMLAADSEAG